MFKNFPEKWLPTEPEAPPFVVEHTPPFRASGEQLASKEELSGGQHGGGGSIPPRPLASTIPPQMVMQVSQQEIQRCQAILSKKPPDSDEMSQQISLMKTLRIHLRDLPKKGPREAKMMERVDKMIDTLTERLKRANRAKALPRAKIGKFWQEKPAEKAAPKPGEKDVQKGPAGGEKDAPAKDDKKKHQEMEKIKADKSKEKDDGGKGFER
ncbi:MAG: hypothetical protein KC609_22070 [Myxococcales bacterium]|nr:hypothetical protein [Myxococcales bacterium]